MKTGRFSIDEMEFIEAHMSMSDKDLAQKLDRRVPAVREARRKIVVNYASGKTITLNTLTLKERPFWELLQRQFIPDELHMFEYSWNAILTQFKEDITPTEEMQVVALITCDILLSRNLEIRKSSFEQAQRIESLLKTMHKIPEDNREPKWISDVAVLEQQLAALRLSDKVNTDERVKLEQQRSVYLRDLKGTRDQRIQSAANATQNWTMLLTQLENEEFRQREGRQTELMALAADKVVQKFGEYHVFGEGDVDRPILNADTVNMGEEE